LITARRRDLDRRPAARAWRERQCRAAGVAVLGIRRVAVLAIPAFGGCHDRSQSILSIPSCSISVKALQNPSIAVRPIFACSGVLTSGPVDRKIVPIDGGRTKTPRRQSLKNTKA